ncbi:isoleucine--tRNA ligase [Sphingomicrobium clamense]|uniref:Isoleucine--tRNA ligase n=1 Tax=Sphingomicrobium clamense TaxID=2851013 RepID=A0ABS6V4R3_9SPHN|nr:isoleucine--tRNA ligase [Sphingomicrobium sp. B8]MBW0144350.1 isoleucine--tRNA ligase [Sphingomicrobium sp. B8]
MSDKPNYKDTVFLPKTDFPMKAGLPQKEPGILERWQSEGLYEQLREERAGREKFILHDGPPYANGDIHIGHALNHVLKDMVCRSQTLLGKDAPYVPGWDCHGLPIEWKVEELYRKKKRNKNEVPATEFRAECRAYAQKWVDVQREQLKRLGIQGRWDKPYLTMRAKAEADIVAELFKFAETGQLYRGAKPVMWSPVEETALAEAEVEYEDIQSTQIDVAFEIVESPIEELVGAHAVIWTTTPWTIPVNQALAYGPQVVYALVEVEDAKESHLNGKRLLVAESLIMAVKHRLQDSYDDDGLELVAIEPYGGSDLAGTVARHPMHHLGGFYAEPRPFLPGEFVTTDSGTGLVHMAPDHGEDDFELCRQHGIGPKFAVERDGRYRDDWLWLGAHDERRRSVINKPFNAPEGPICSDLREAGALLSASADYHHSYPHSWRSKAKVIYRCTPQWFIAIDEPLHHLDPKTRAEIRWENEGGPANDGGKIDDYPTLRETAMDAIDKTRFVPDKGRNRLASMVEGRPDWLISRQRAWGVPIALFVHRESGELLVDTDVNKRITDAIREMGIDAWSEERMAEYLGPDRNADDYEMVGDILDVWFDSGSTHAFVLESDEWPELRSPADLYLEGSDQHRGWFQSSLLESCGTRGRAPYKAVLTHGFTMDSAGKKMSKSLGNTIDPLKVMEQFGADIIRLWALSVDYTEDHRIGDEILRGVGDQYRKLRNSFRYMIGALADFSDDEKVDPADMPELERYMLHRLAEIDGVLRQAVEDFDFNLYTRTLADFANEELSAFFFDIRKDCLYCDDTQGVKRRSYRTVLDILFHAMVRWAAPVLVFTAEEVWGTRYPDGGSVHLLEWPEVDAGWKDEALAKRWGELIALRESVTEAIEPYRKDKVIRSSLQAEVGVPSDEDSDFLAELFISGPVANADSVTITPTEHAKCGRCWRHLPEVEEDGDLCDRCDEVLN